ncbi:MAG: SIS domain-containing protein, partial [Phototrophicales bacterium]
MNASQRYMQEAQQILTNIINNEMPAIEEAAEICANSIAGDGLVHMFATGHSRILIEEMYPRHGSFPGFHSMVELSLTFHNQVVGSNGQRQAMFIEHIEGLAEQILKNFV